MPEIARVTVTQLADYGTFFLHDQEILDADPDDDAAVAASRGRLLGAGTHRAYLRTGQKAVAVTVTVEIWDASPPDQDLWDARDEVAIVCPSGQLLMQNTGNGPVGPAFVLPAGTTGVRIRAYGAELDLQDEVDQVYEDSAGEPFAVLNTRLRALDGRERYLLQIWPRN